MSPIAMANMLQTLRALSEAEKYKGPSSLSLFTCVNTELKTVWA
jgi:hypothetical protein